MQQFEDVVPGSAKAIIDNFVREGDHRRRMESVSTWSEAIQRVGGLFAAAGLSGSALYIAYNLILQGRDIGGIAAMLAALAPLVGTFIVHAHKRGQARREDRQSKPKEEQLKLELHGGGSE